LRLQRRDQLSDGLFAFAAHDRVDMRLFAQDLAPVIGRKHTAIDDVGVGKCVADGKRKLGDHRMAGGRAGMAEQQRVRAEPCGLRHDVGSGHRAELAVEQPHRMAVVDQWPADGKQPERRQVLVRDAAADRRVRDVDEKDAHGRSIRTCSSVSAAGVRGG
jgi:hypothetical protein